MTEQADDLTLVNLERYLVYRQEISVGSAKIFNLDHR
jgi:hypothetical protein